MERLDRLWMHTDTRLQQFLPGLFADISGATSSMAGGGDEIRPVVPAVSYCTHPDPL